MNESLLTAFVGVTSLAVVLQMLILAGMYFATRKATERVEKLSIQMNEQVLPLVTKVRGLVDESTPAIQTMVRNLTETSTLVREQAGKINETATEIVEMARTQAGQANILATRTMQRVDLTAAAVQHAALSPVRRLSAVMEGVTAGIGSFVSGRKARQDKAVPSDEMFI